MAVDIVSLAFEVDASKVSAASAALKDMGAQAIETQRALSQTQGGYNDAAGAVNQFEGVLGTLRNALMMTGVAFAGMGLTDFAYQATLAAARFETLGMVMTRIAENTNYSSTQLFQFARGIQSTGISMVEARQSVIQLIQAHLDLSQATKLARVAQDAAVVGNMNSTDAYMRLIYGIQTGQTETLRTVGINVSFEASMAKLAQTLGKTVAALTDQEKAQARMNAVIEAGAAISGSYESAMETAGKQLNSMKRYTDDLSTTLGQAFLPAFSDAIFGVTSGIKNLQKYLDTPSGKALLDSVSALAISFERNLIPILSAVAAVIVVRLIPAITMMVYGWGTAMVAFAVANPVLLGVMALAGGMAYLAMRTTDASRAMEHGLELQKQFAAADQAPVDLSTAQGRMDAEATLSAQKFATDRLVADQRNATQGTESGVANAMRQGGQNLAGLGFWDSSLRGGAQAPAINTLRRSLGDSANNPADSSVAGLAAAQASVNAIRDSLRQSTDVNAPHLLEVFNKLTAPIDDATKSVSGLNRALADSVKKTGDMADALGVVHKALLDTSTMQTKMNAALGSTGLVYDPSVGFQAKAIQTAEAAYSAYDSFVQGLRVNNAINAGIAQDPGESEAKRSVALKSLTEDTRTLSLVLTDQQAIYARTQELATSAYGKMLQTVRLQTEQLAGANDPTQAARISAEQSVRTQLYAYGTPQGGGDPGYQLKATKDDIDKAWAAAKQQGIALPDIHEVTEQAEREAKAIFLVQSAGNIAAELSLAKQAAQQAQVTEQAEIRASFAYKIAAAEADGGEAVRKVTAEMERAVEGSKANANFAALAAKSYAEQAKAIGDAVAKLKDMGKEQAYSQSLIDAMKIGPGAVAAAQAAIDVDKFMKPLQDTSKAAIVVPGAAAAGSVVPAGAPTTQIPVATYAGIYADAFAAAAANNNLPPNLLPSIAMKESSMNPNAMNKSGAAGLMQIMPSTGIDPGMGVAGVGNAMDPLQAIAFAARYIAALKVKTGSLEGAINQYSGHGYQLADMQTGGTGGSPAVSPMTPAMLASAQQTRQGLAANASYQTVATRLGGAGGGQIQSQQEALTLAQAETAATGLDNAQHEKAIALATLEIQRKKDLAQVIGDTATMTAQQQKDEINGQYDTLRGIQDQIAAQKELTQASQDMADMGRGVGEAFSTAFEDVAFNGKKVGDVLDTMMTQIAKLVIQTQLMKPLEQMLSNMAGGQDTMSGVGGWLGSIGKLVGGGTSAIGAATLASNATYQAGAFAAAGLGAMGPFAARGGVFPGRFGLGDYEGQVIDRPTGFRFASGGAFGEMGEAGPEAILPLRRGKDGRLGIATSAGAGAALPPIEVHVYGVTNPDTFKRSAPQILRTALIGQQRASARAGG